MVLWRTFHNSSSFSGLVMVLCILFSMSPVRAQYHNGHVGIVNSFRSPTQFTCHSNKMTRQTYTATWDEVYYFAFDSANHQYWDCRIYNRGWGILDTFRFWGDASHGGPALWNCENCIWSVQEDGVYIYIDAVWRFKCHWHSAT